MFRQTLIVLAALGALFAAAAATQATSESKVSEHPLTGQWCHVVWDGGRPESGTVVSLDADWLVLRAEKEPDRPALWIPRARIKGIAAFERHPDDARGDADTLSLP